MRREATDLLRSAPWHLRHGPISADTRENTAEAGDDPPPSVVLPARPHLTEARDVTWASALVEHCIGTLLREARASRRRHASRGAASRGPRDHPQAPARSVGSALVRKTQFPPSKPEREDIFDALLDAEQIVSRSRRTPSGTQTHQVVTARRTEPLLGGALNVMHPMYQTAARRTR